MSLFLLIDTTLSNYGHLLTERGCKIISPPESANTNQSLNFICLYYLIAITRKITTLFSYKLFQGTQLLLLKDYHISLEAYFFPNERNFLGWTYKSLYNAAWGCCSCVVDRKQSRATLTLYYRYFQYEDS